MGAGEGGGCCVPCWACKLIRLTLLKLCKLCKKLVFNQDKLESNFKEQKVPKQKDGMIKFIFQKESLGRV